MATAVMLPLTGKIFTNFSTKWFYIAFVVTFCIGSAISGAANSSAMLIGGRVITGLGASGIYNGSQTLMVAGIPTNKRPLIFSLVVAGMLSQIEINNCIIPRETSLLLRNSIKCCDQLLIVEAHIPSYLTC